MGRKTDNGEFSDFVEKFSAGKTAFSGTKCRIPATRQWRGPIRWKGGFSVVRVEIQLNDHPRYDNPFVKVEFIPAEVQITTDECELALNGNTISHHSDDCLSNGT